MKGWSRRFRRNNPGGAAPASPPAIATPVVARPVRPARPTTPATCHTCRRALAPGERHVQTSRPLSGQRRYHRTCFVCRHCHAPIDVLGSPPQRFLYARLESGSEEGSGHGGAARSNNNGNGETRNNDSNNNGGGHGESEHPFHRECFARHFGWICVVCEHPLPMVLRPRTTDDTHDRRSTKVEFLRHPFFDHERMCPHHVRKPAGGSGNHAGGTANENNRHDGNSSEDNGAIVVRDSASTVAARTEESIGEVRRCAGCHRFEPLVTVAPSKHFVDVGDADTGRCVCLACCRTVVTSNDDALPLWRRVVDFFEGPLGLISGEGMGVDEHRFGGVTRRDMDRIPVLVVGAEALNENMERHPGTGHLRSTQIMTRGLCLSERTTVPCHRGGGGTGRRDHEEEVGVTAILCLSGLPSDLAASILAHEATHAWIKLHPNFPCHDPLPLRVEEGLCQLVAFLFLNDGLDPPARSRDEEDGNENGDDAATGVPSEERLRQYFRFCIETDEGVYGEGFRSAAMAYARMGMQELLYYVAVHREFPPPYVDRTASC